MDSNNETIEQELFFIIINVVFSFLINISRLPAVKFYQVLNNVTYSFTDTFRNAGHTWFPKTKTTQMELRLA